MPKKLAKKQPAPKKVAKKVTKQRPAPKRVAKKQAAPQKVARVNPIPDGLTTLTANLIVNGATQAIAFYQAAFGAKLLSSAPSPDGKGIWHAALQVGNAQFFVNDPMPGEPSKSGGQLWLYGPDVDARYARAVKAGAQATAPLWDTFWGDRFGVITDPFGQMWCLAERKQELTPEEMLAGGEAFAKQMAAQGGEGPPS